MGFLTHFRDHTPPLLKILYPPLSMNSEYDLCLVRDFQVLLMIYPHILTYFVLLVCRLEPNDFGNILRVVLPDLGMLIVGLCVYFICRKLCSVPSTDSSDDEDEENTQTRDSEHTQNTHDRGDGADELIDTTHSTGLTDMTSHSHQHHHHHHHHHNHGQRRMTSQVKERIVQHSSVLVRFMGEFFVGLFLGASGIIWPSGLSTIYFLLFLAIGTWWGCYRSLGKKFAVIRFLMLIYSGLHIILIYLYQFQFFQIILPPSSLVAR